MIFSPTAISERKNRAAQALSKVLKPGELLLVSSGSSIQKPGGHDQTYPFLPHPDYFWLTGFRRPYGISAFTTDAGWKDFVLPVTKEEKIWEGGADQLAGTDVAQFQSWLTSLKPKKIFAIGQSDNSGRVPATTDEDTPRIQETFSRVRRIKDSEEITLISSIARMAAAGYSKIKPYIKPGVSERQIQLAYEAEVFKQGAEKMPYDSIVGTGTNSAVLHAIPTARIVKAGEHVLIDAGADLHDYCVDITRVFPAAGAFSAQQKAIYDTVKKAQDTSIALCRPGVQWSQVHLASARVMAQGLYDLGILKIPAEEALQTGAIGLFFPHGVGHMVGLKVRDVGGPPNPNPKKYGGARLRVDMALEDGFLMTVEPGLYFIPALLDDPDSRTTFKDQVNWTEVEKWKDFGGVRIEDDIHITAAGPRNLTLDTCY